MVSVGDSLIGTVLGQVSFTPVLVLASRLCPRRVEATLFAALMSISKGVGVVGRVIGVWLTDHFGVTSENFDNLGSFLRHFWVCCPRVERLRLLLRRQKILGTLTPRLNDLPSVSCPPEEKFPASDVAYSLWCIQRAS